MLVLVAYDIANQKRLHRVARLMKSFGTRVQRSVFECSLSRTRLESMTSLLNQTINPRYDRVHIYLICQSCQPKFSFLGSEALVEWEENLLII